MPLFRRKRNLEQDAATISVAELKRMLDRNEDVLVLDVRKRAAFAESPFAIPGEFVISPEDLPERYHELPKDRLIAAYCT
jgi:rhodanese-related sulfurtransferase